MRPRPKPVTARAASRALPSAPPPALLLPILAPLLAPLFLLFPPAVPGLASDPAAQEPGPLEVVEAFFDAYGERDVERATALVSDDFVWYAVTDDSLVVQARGREELARSLTGYFESVPSARSSVEATLVAGGLVALRERAVWSGPDGDEREATSLAVYEVREGLIRRAWYYPAEP